MGLFYHELTPDGFNARAVTRVICHEKTEFQTIDIVEHPLLGISLYCNHYYQTEEIFQKSYHEFMISEFTEAHNIVICGYGPGGLAKTCLKKLNPESILGIEIDEEAYHLYKKHLGDWGTNDPRVTVVFDDAVKVLSKLPPNSVDVILWDADSNVLLGNTSVIWQAIKAVLVLGGRLSVTAGYDYERMATDPYTKLKEELKANFPTGTLLTQPQLNWQFFFARKL